MAWTRSAPQGETVAADQIGLRSLRRCLVAILNIGKGDSARGLSIVCAAFLTILGAAVPNLTSAEITALLFLSGAALVAFAMVVPTLSSVRNIAPNNNRVARAEHLQSAPQHRQAGTLNELLDAPSRTTYTDRAAWARLTSHMSHELRTPLNAILGFSELMTSEVFGPLGSSLYADYARDIHASGHSLLKSAEDALAITVLLTAPDQPHRRDITHLATAAQSAIAFHASDFANRNLTAISTLDIDAEIVGQEQSVRQLVINLLSDAAERAKPNATITLASRQIDSQIEISVMISDECAAPYRAAESFSLLLARTLAELSGAIMIENCDSKRTGQIVVRFTRATQDDFFASQGCNM